MLAATATLALLLAHALRSFTTMAERPPESDHVAQLVAMYPGVGVASAVQLSEHLIAESQDINFTFSDILQAPTISSLKALLTCLRPSLDDVDGPQLDGKNTNRTQGSSPSWQPRFLLPSSKRMITHIPLNRDGKPRYFIIPASLLEQPTRRGAFTVHNQRPPYEAGPVGMRVALKIHFLHQDFQEGDVIAFLVVDTLQTDISLTSSKDGIGEDGNFSFPVGQWFKDPNDGCMVSRAESTGNFAINRSHLHSTEELKKRKFGDKLAPWTWVYSPVSRTLRQARSKDIVMPLQVTAAQSGNMQGSNSSSLFFVVAMRVLHNSAVPANPELWLKRQPLVHLELQWYNKWIDGILSPLVEVTICGSVVAVAAAVIAAVVSYRAWHVVALSSSYESKMM